MNAATEQGVVDVLAVVDRWMDDLATPHRCVDDFRPVRAAIAELVEAAESARETLQKLADMGRLPVNSKGLRDVTAALTRCTGGAK